MTRRGCFPWREAAIDGKCALGNQTCPGATRGVGPGVTGPKARVGPAGSRLAGLRDRRKQGCKCRGHDQRARQADPGRHPPVTLYLSGQSRRIDGARQPCRAPCGLFKQGRECTRLVEPRALVSTQSVSGRVEALGRLRRWRAVRCAGEPGTHARRGCVNLVKGLMCRGTRMRYFLASG